MSKLLTAYRSPLNNALKYTSDFSTYSVPVMSNLFIKHTCINIPVYLPLKKYFHWILKCCWNNYLILHKKVICYRVVPGSVNHDCILTNRKTAWYWNVLNGRYDVRIVCNHVIRYRVLSSVQVTHLCMVDIGWYQ